MATPQLGKTGKYGDLKKRLTFLLLALIVFRIGAHIPVPGIDPIKLAELFQSQQGGILGLFNMFSGGALSRFTIFALGIMPYISASIIMQLMTAVSPQLEQLRKEGQAGQRKITQYTRYGTVFLALFQATGISIALESQAGLVIDPGLMFRFTTVVTLVTGTMFLMWLGEQVTERGLGNGISIIIFAGIAAGLPNAVAGMLELVRTGAMFPLTSSAVRGRYWSTTPSARSATRSTVDRPRTCPSSSTCRASYRRSSPHRSSCSPRPLPAGLRAVSQAATPGNCCRGDRSGRHSA